MRRTMGICLAGLFIQVILASAGALLAAEKSYVGSETCSECHPEEYARFMKYSRKAHSFESIKKMEKKLTPEEYKGCFDCHTTGYGQKDGFISEEETPALKNAGCEVCHGPGSLHAESGDPEDIITEMDRDNCMVCHSQERVSEFKFKPLLFGGAH